MKWNWYIPLTEAQGAKLKAGLQSYFRFYLRLAVETVWYNSDSKVLTVYVSKGMKPELLEQIGVYINGYSQAISQ